MGFAAIVAISRLLSRRPRQGKQRDPEKVEDTGDQQANAMPDHCGEDEDEDARSPPVAGPNRFRRYYTWSSNSTFTHTQGRWTHVSWLSKVKAYIFPKDEQPADIERFVPNYRYSPIISGVLIPLSILLEIPGLTVRWYVRTLDNKVVETKPNPPILDAGMGISIGCAILANICLITRFLEKWVKPTTLLCILFLTIHDGINIVAVTVFGVVHRVDDGFTYGQSFWITLCSTIVTTITNVNLIIDFVRVPDFAHSSSGLTRKQRSLVVLVIILLMYIALGALINSRIMSLDYIDALYFTVVSIETIGFGDIVPQNTGGRVFICFYIAFGIILLGIVISLCRVTVLEGLEVGYKKRLRSRRARRREARRYRRWQQRWRAAVEWRLKENHKPVWIADEQPGHEEEGVRFVGLGGPRAGADEAGWLVRFLRTLGLQDLPPEDPAQRASQHVPGHPHGKHLNIGALSDAQLEAAALEAGVPLEMFVDFSPARRIARERRFGPHGAVAAGGWPSDVATPTNAQVGRMAAVLTEVAMAFSGREIHVPRPSAEDQATVMDGIAESRDVAVREHSARNPDVVRRHRLQAQKQSSREKQNIFHRWILKIINRSKVTSSAPYNRLEKELEDEEKNANTVKLSVAWIVFLLFWLVGSAIFSATEKWSYAMAMYFCFISFTTTGYGDLAPVSPAGRSIFVVWALLGVAALTILAAAIEDAGSSRYQDAMRSTVFDKAVKKYRWKAAREAADYAEYQLQRARSNARLNATGSSQNDPQTAEYHDEKSVSAKALQLEDKHAAAQRELEALPAEIIRQARTFHNYMRYLTKGNGHDHEDLPGEGTQMRVPTELKRLLDELLEDEGVTDGVKREILQDDDAKHALFVLSVERAMKTMIQSAERALAAIAGRDLPSRPQEEQDSRTTNESSKHGQEENRSFIYANHHTEEGSSSRPEMSDGFRSSSQSTVSRGKPRTPDQSSSL